MIDAYLREKVSLAKKKSYYKSAEVFINNKSESFKTYKTLKVLNEHPNDIPVLVNSK